MGFLAINLESKVTLLVKIIEKGHRLYRATVPVETTLNDILSLGVPEILFDKKVFECLGNPSNHYEIKGFIACDIDIKGVELGGVSRPWIEERSEITPDIMSRVKTRMCPKWDNLKVCFNNCSGECEKL